jgi:hypothetical protein
MAVDDEVVVTVVDVVCVPPCVVVVVVVKVFVVVVTEGAVYTQLQALESRLAVELQADTNVGRVAEYGPARY